MKTEKINYKFIPVPLKLTLLLDEKCTKVLTHLIQLHFAFADENDMYFRSIDLLCEETQLSKRVLNAVLVTLNNLYIVDVYSVGQSKGKKTNQFRINFKVIETYDSIEFETILKINKIKTWDYTDKSFKVEYHNVQNLITKSDNDSDNNLQNLITKSVLEQKLKEYSQNLITKSAKINHNIDNTIIDNTYKNNIGPNIGPNNNIIYISEQLEGKVNCFIPEKEIEGYINSSEAFNESETGKENIDNSNLDNTTANAESGIEESVNSNEVIPNNNLDNSNNVNTAVLSPSNSLFEESVISTKKTSENGLKQAKTRELGIVNKTDNSNLKNLSTANAVTEETVYSNIDNSKEVEGNNSIDNSKLVNSDNRTNNISTIVEYSTANAELESNNSVNSKNVIPNNNLDNSKNVNSNTANAVTEKVDNLNSVKPVIEEGIEEENKTDNSNSVINSTIAFGDNSTANAVQEFRDKCIKYTIILEGKKIEIDRSVDVFVQSYYNELKNNIYDTKEFDKQRKIFNKMIVDNHLDNTKYDQMCDKLDVIYSRYIQFDKQANKQTDKEEFTQEEIKYIANELLKQCLEFKLIGENNMQDFYTLRNEYNAFIEQYNIPKEGLKLQKKFAELSTVNKKLNTPVKSQSFAV